MKNQIIHPRHLPVPLPVYQTLVIVMAFDRWPVPEWLAGIIYFWLALGYIAAIYRVFTSQWVYIRGGRITDTKP